MEPAKFKALAEAALKAYAAIKGPLEDAKEAAIGDDAPNFMVFDPPAAERLATSLKDLNEACSKLMAAVKSKGGNKKSAPKGDALGRTMDAIAKNPTRTLRRKSARCSKRTTLMVTTTA